MSVSFCFIKTATASVKVEEMLRPVQLAATTTKKHELKVDVAVKQKFEEGVAITTERPHVVPMLESYNQTLLF